MPKERQEKLDELDKQLEDSGKKRWAENVERSGGIQNIPDWEKVAFEIASCTPRHEGFPIGSRYEEDKENGKHYLDLCYEKFLELDDNGKVQVVRYLHQALNRSRIGHFGERAIYQGLKPAYLFQEGRWV